MKRNAERRNARKGTPKYHHVEWLCIEELEYMHEDWYDDGDDGMEDAPQPPPVPDELREQLDIPLSLDEAKAFLTQAQAFLEASGYSDITFEELGNLRMRTLRPFTAEEKAREKVREAKQRIANAKRKESAARRKEQADQRKEEKDRKLLEELLKKYPDQLKAIEKFED